MVGLLEKPISKGGITLTDAVVVVAGKIVGDMSGQFIPFVENRTMTGGLIKVASALALAHFFDNRLVRAGALGVGISGIEDVVSTLLNRGVAPTGLNEQVI